MEKATQAPHRQFAICLLRENGRIPRWSPPASEAVETTDRVRSERLERGHTKGIIAERAVAATTTPIRPFDVSFGGSQPKAAWVEVQGVSRSICERMMASRKPEACPGSSRNRNAKRRLARTISTCPPASRERIRAPASSTNLPSVKRSGASAMGRADRFRSTFTTNVESSCSTTWNFLVGRRALTIDRIAEATSSTHRDSTSVI